VRWVQSALNRIDNAGLTVNGAMSPATRSALRAFQTRQGLPPDGIAGPDTEQALRDAQRPAAGSDPGSASEPASTEFELNFEEANEDEFETLAFESPSSMPTLRQGSRGTAVADLQRRLGKAGFSAGAADGIFGAQTDAAVRSFQRSRGLSADGIVGSMTWGALLNVSPAQPATPPGGGPWGGGSGAIKYGKGWGGSEGVADAAKAIAASMSIPVTSQKRNLEDTLRVGSNTGSDHYTGNTNAYATDFGVSGTRGDELARAIATKYGIPYSVIGSYDRTTMQVGDRRYSLQLLWKVNGHFNHVHFGIRRA
jgi:peptidoglycan hydrolase-like protein with peptidoglycan-binding domain